MHRPRRRASRSTCLPRGSSRRTLPLDRAPRERTARVRVSVDVPVTPWRVIGSPGPQGLRDQVSLWGHDPTRGNGSLFHSASREDRPSVASPRRTASSGGAVETLERMAALPGRASERGSERLPVLDRTASRQDVEALPECLWPSPNGALGHGFACVRVVPALQQVRAEGAAGSSGAKGRS